MKPQRFHRYKPVDTHLAIDRLNESFWYHGFVRWRERIDARGPGSIAFAPAAK